MDNAIIDNLSVVEDLHEAAIRLEMNALDWDGGEYVDVRKDDFEALKDAADSVGEYVKGEGDSGA